MHPENWPLALVYLLIVGACHCRLSADDNREENHIDHVEFYQNVHRKLPTTTAKPGKFSIFQKRTRPMFRRNNKHETFLTNYKFISNATEDDRQTGKRLNKSKASVEFVGFNDGSLNRRNVNDGGLNRENINEGRLNRPNTISDQHHRNSITTGISNSSNAKADSNTSLTGSMVSSSSDLVDLADATKANRHVELTQSQQTMLAFEHGNDPLLMDDFLIEIFN